MQESDNAIRGAADHSSTAAAERVPVGGALPPRTTDSSSRRGGRRGRSAPTTYVRTYRRGMGVLGFRWRPSSAAPRCKTHASTTATESDRDASAAKSCRPR
eukprot:GHVU01064408.1.p1 GENE.GHVU01064408.1~~GHVU01064408.1.p1  ORF type:complete len:101 (-),score=12.00 GHVU01064408.1:352-654(-)